MTKRYCDICGKELDFSYNRYNAIYDVKTKWHEPHQTTIDSNGMATCTLLGYLHPGDVDIELCEDCGFKVVEAIKEKINELKSNIEIDKN